MIQKNNKQSNLTSFFNFDRSSKCASISENLNTSTQGTPFYFDPMYKYSCKKDYSFFSDPYSWKKPEEPDDCSRGDIKKAYRLGRWY